MRTATLPGPLLAGITLSALNTSKGADHRGCGGDKPLGKQPIPAALHIATVLLSKLSRTDRIGCSPRLLAAGLSKKGGAKG
jgi:hypothetical protein